MIGAMSPIDAVVEVTGPLLLGLLCGALFRQFMYPRVLEWLGPMAAPMVKANANPWLGALVGVLPCQLVAVASHDVNAPDTLEWLRGHAPSLAPTPAVLHGIFLVATFLSGYTLVNLPTSSSTSEDPARPA
jgi:hypothetical protein